MKKKFKYKYRLYQVDDKGMIEYFVSRGYYHYSDSIEEFDTEEEAMNAIPQCQYWSIQKLIRWVDYEGDEE